MSGNQYLTQVLKQASHDINSIHQSLVVEGDNAIRRFPEAAFIENFLPYFSGKLSFDDNPNMMETWRDICGTPTAEVIIVDNAGKELYRVPPIYDTSGVKSQITNTRLTVSEMVDTYKLHVNNIPVVGQNYITNASTAKVNDLIPAQVSINEARWTAIFQRYGIIPTQEQAAPVAPEDNLADDVDYD